MINIRYYVKGKKIFTICLLHASDSVKRFQ